MYAFTWKKGSWIGADAQETGTALHTLAQQIGKPFDELTATDVVVAAQDPASPLHTLFEWDDTVAAQKYRKTQAGWVLHNIHVEVVSSKEQRQPISYVSVKVSDKPQSVPTTLASHSASLRQQTLADARKGLQGWVRRYEHLSEIGTAMERVREVLAQLDALVEDEETVAV